MAASTELVRKRRLTIARGSIAPDHLFAFVCVSFGSMKIIKQRVMCTFFYSCNLLKTFLFCFESESDNHIAQLLTPRFLI